MLQQFRKSAGHVIPVYKLIITSKGQISTLRAHISFFHPPLHRFMAKSVWKWWHINLSCTFFVCVFCRLNYDGKHGKNCDYEHVNMLIAFSSKHCSTAEGKHLNGSISWAWQAHKTAIWLFSYTQYRYQNYLQSSLERLERMFISSSSCRRR